MEKREVIRDLVNELKKDGYVPQLISSRFVSGVANLETVTVKPEYIKAWADVHMPVQTFVDRSQYPSVVILFVLEETND